MRRHYDFERVKVENNPYVKRLKQPRTGHALPESHQSVPAGLRRQSTKAGAALGFFGVNELIGLDPTSLKQQSVSFLRDPGDRYVPELLRGRSGSCVSRLVHSAESSVAAMITGVVRRGRRWAQEIPRSPRWPASLVACLLSNCGVSPRLLLLLTSEPTLSTVYI